MRARRDDNAVARSGTAVRENPEAGPWIVAGRRRCGASILALWTRRQVAVLVGAATVLAAALYSDFTAAETLSELVYECSGVVEDLL